MAGFFNNLGQMAGPQLRKGKWLWMSATGTEEDILEAEREVGTDLAAQFAHQLGLDGDVELGAWVRRIGMSLSQNTKEKHREWTFLVSVEGEPNAFALPGGYVFISRSLIEMVEGAPDEVAFVLGHEIAHVVKRHPMRRIVSDVSLGSAMKVLPRVVRLPGLPGGVGKVAGMVKHLPGMEGVPDVGEAQGWLTEQVSGLLRANYSQEDELYADKLGARLAKAAGYDAQAGVRLLGRLKVLEDRVGGGGGEGGGVLGEYFGSHPPLVERVGALERYLKLKA